MKHFITLACAILLSCGGGGGSVASSSNTGSSTNASSSASSTLLPGSVGSFQPLDIDDWLWKKYLFFYWFAQYPYFPLILQETRKIITCMVNPWMILLSL